MHAAPIVDARILAANLSKDVESAFPCPALSLAEVISDKAWATSDARSNKDKMIVSTISKSSKTQSLCADTSF